MVLRVLRVLRRFIAVIGCSGLWAGNVTAQVYPAKPIRLIFGYTAGGAGDVSARMLAQKLSEMFGQQVVVENRPGAGGAIADEFVAQSPADGYTLLYAAGSTAILPSLRPKLPYDVARTQPGRLTFSSPGIGSSSHFAAELFKMMADVKILHVPFKGPPEATTAVVSGELDIGFPSVTGALPFVATNRLKALAVSSAKRASQLPAVPTLNEAGLAGYERSGWNGVLAPAAVPKDIITRLNAAIVKIVGTSEIREAFFKQGLEAQTNTPEQFAAFIQRELAQNARVVKFAGIRAE